jgi:hypothetical protein
MDQPQRRLLSAAALPIPGGANQPARLESRKAAPAALGLHLLSKWKIGMLHWNV